MAPARLSIFEARKIIYSQEDISLSIKRSAWRLFRHELERPDPKTGRPVSMRRALDRVLSYMLLQAEKEKLSAYKINATQKRILYLIVVEGFTQGQTALAMNKSIDTVKSYCINLKKQLGCDSMYQVVAIAVERGWIPPPSISLPKSV